VGCWRKPPPPPAVRPDVVARVDGVPITIHDVVAESERLHAVRQTVEDPAAFLQRLVDRQALVSVALSQGLHRDAELARQYENMLIGALRERQLTPRLEGLTVTDEEVQAYYEANRDRYRVAGTIHLAVLRLQCPAGRSDEAATTLKAVREDLAASPQAAPGFGTLAVANSDHQPSRYQGGDIGWLRDGKGPAWLPSQVIAAAWELSQPGQVSEVLVTDQAVFLLRLIGRKDGGTRPLVDASGTIRGLLLAGKRQEAEEAFLAQARQAVTVEVHPTALAAAVEQLRQRTPGPGSEPPAPPPPPP